WPICRSAWPATSTWSIRPSRSNRRSTRAGSPAGTTDASGRLLAGRTAPGDREMREVRAEAVMAADQTLQRPGLLQRQRVLDPAVRTHQVDVLVLAGPVVL